jgi:threonine dehydratase
MVLHPDLASIREARRLLERYLPVTRLRPATRLGEICGSRVALKLETDLPTGSFKVRGAIFSLALQMQRSPVRVVLASSTGNHGAAVAYAASLLGIPAKIFLPENPNPVKKARIAAFGAEIVERGRDISDACQEAMLASAALPGGFFLNDATDVDLPSATGVIGLEIMEQSPQAQTIFVPIGDSALIRGIAAAVKQIRPEVRVIGVQAQQAPSYYLSWRQGAVVETEDCQTIADGLATRRPVPASVQAIQGMVDEIVLVSEEELLQAVDALLMEEHVLAEPAGAAATAALLKFAGADGHGGVQIVVVTGANISRDTLRRAVQVVG